MSGEQSGERPSKSAHIKNIKALPCMVTDRPTNLERHHAHGGSIRDELGISRGKSQKTNHFLLIPLAQELHTGPMNPEAMGVPAWEQLVAKQTELLARVSELVGYDVIKFALDFEELIG